MSDDGTIRLELPTNTRWSAELELSPDGMPCFIGVEKDGAAYLAGINEGDVLCQIGFTKIQPRSLQSACQTIWEEKRNARSLSKATVSCFILPASVHLSRTAVSPMRRRGDRRRHGHGDQGKVNINEADGRRFQSRGALHSQKNPQKMSKKYAPKLGKSANHYDMSRLDSPASSILNRVHRAVHENSKWRINVDKMDFLIPGNADVEVYDDGVAEAEDDESEEDEEEEDELEKERVGEHQVTIVFTWKEQVTKGGRRTKKKKKENKNKIKKIKNKNKKQEECKGEETKSGGGGGALTKRNVALLNVNKSTKEEQLVGRDRDDDVWKEEDDVVGMNKLHSLIRWNKEPLKMRELLSLKPNLVNVHDPRNGNTAIHIAAQNGHLDVVTMLIETGADVDAKNSKGNTALHVSRFFFLNKTCWWLVRVYTLTLFLPFFFPFFCRWQWRTTTFGRHDFSLLPALINVLLMMRIMKHHTVLTVR